MDEVRLVDASKIENQKIHYESEQKENVELFLGGAMAVMGMIHNAPTIDPESLRGHAKWVKDKELKFITVDDENNSHEEPAICCTHCKAKLPQSDFDSWVWNFCPVCGFKMEDATNG